MLNNLKTRTARLAAALKLRIAAWLRRGKPTQQGRWSRGEHRESTGSLSFAPMVASHRGYQLYFPIDFRKDERLPLVVMLHGCKQDPKSFAAGTRMNSFADRERFLVLYPEQRRLANPYLCWNWFDPSSHRGDGEVAIVAGMVRKIAKEHNADLSRIYVAGLSSGGALASALASCYADVFAACAIHSGLMFQAASSPAVALSVMQNGSERDPETAGEAAFDRSGKNVKGMPVMVIHGDADNTVHPVNAEQIVAQFLAMNQDALRDSSTARTIEKSNGSGYHYSISDYGPARAPLIRHIAVKGMGHAWSGGSSHSPYNDPRGPDASEMIIEFFTTHRRENSQTLSS